MRPLPSPAANEFTRALNAKFGGTKNPETVFDIEAGKKFDRITQKSIWERGSSQGPSVHAFVERDTGRLIKAGGYKAPQKDKDGNPAYRYSIRDMQEIEAVIAKADVFGSYLYAR